MDGFYLSESFKTFLETELIKVPDVHRVSASTLTNNILVSYNSSNDHETIAALIEDVIKKASPDPKPSATMAAGLKTVDQAAYPGKKSTPAGKLHSRPDTGSEIAPIVPFHKGTDGSWHRLTANKVLSTFNTDRDGGLKTLAAAELLKQYGPNALPEPEPRSGWNIFVDQLNSLPVYLLGAAAGVSIATGGFLDALLIAGVVVANAVVGYLTESSAERTIHSLKTLVKPRAEVIRNGKVIDIPIEEVVVGDLLRLKPGAYIAADGRVIESSNLSIDESMLTGESMPVSKNQKPIKRDNVPLADRKNMVYMGTLVTGGQGVAVVVATAAKTEIGNLQLLIGNTSSPKTPIERQLSRMGDQLVILCGIICGVVFLMGTLRGYGFLQMLRMAISLAAAAVPEGLPAAATINFALGITNMRKHQVLVRHLQAIETLGAVQTICLDKTGTITQNTMSVTTLFSGNKRIEVIKGQFFLARKPLNPLLFEDIKQLLDVCVLCNETKLNRRTEDSEIELQGSPTENALIYLALKSDIDVFKLRDIYTLTDINHRSENRLFMSTLHVSVDSHRMFSLKGSPDEILSMCSWQLVNNKVIPLSEAEKHRIELENERMSGQELRVLGFAFKVVENRDSQVDEQNLIWLGLVGMVDPIRDGVKELIQVLHKSGVDTVMVTGDQSATAYAIAQQLNLSGEKPLEMLDSSELMAVNPDKMEALAKIAHVYSRISPSHKLKIVQAMQSAGKVVAMTGDGINDGPALKAADIGIAMGQSGTDIAREVADVVLKEDNLDILTVALRDGRTTYSNIRKSVHFFLSTNISEILVMFTAMAMGIGFPLNVMQLLWINIISDIFPGLALSMEQPEPDIMEQPPRDPQAPLFASRDVKRMLYESALISIGALSAYGYGITRHGIGPQAASLAFQSLTIGQLLHAISCRSEKKSIFDRGQITPNKHLNMAIGGSLALQIMTMVFPPLRNVLGLTPLNLEDIIIIVGSSIIPLLVNEATKNKGQ
jgi:Ca2+-transporting ATPase